MNGLEPASKYFHWVYSESCTNDQEVPGSSPVIEDGMQVIGGAYQDTMSACLGIHRVWCSSDVVDTWCTVDGQKIITTTLPHRPSNTGGTDCRSVDDLPGWNVLTCTLPLVTLLLDKPPKVSHRNVRQRKRTWKRTDATVGSASLAAAIRRRSWFGCRKSSRVARHYETTPLSRFRMAFEWSNRSRTAPYSGATIAAAGAIQASQRIYGLPHQ